jgi:hypothetical protein
MSDQESELAEQMTPDELDHPDDPETDDAQDGEQDDEAELAAPAPEPRSQKEIEALTKKLEAEAERHAKRVAEIMGDDFGLLVPSPVDWTPGFIFNVPEMLPQPEQVAALHALLGQAPPADYLPAEDAEACDKCSALGLTLTGSRVQGNETKPCGKCNGAGWTAKLPALAQVTPMQGTTLTTSGQPMTPEAYQVRDSWGRPSNHPHFGIDPVSITA